MVREKQEEVSGLYGSIVESKKMKYANRIVLRLVGGMRKI